MKVEMGKVVGKSRDSDGHEYIVIESESGWSGRFYESHVEEELRGNLTMGSIVRVEYWPNIGWHVAELKG